MSRISDLISLSIPSFFRNSEVRKEVCGIAKACADGGGGVGSVTSVGVSMPASFTVTGSPITSSGTITVTGAGTTSQYVRGDGSLATLPTASTIYTADGVIPAGVDRKATLGSATSTLNFYDFSSSTGIELDEGDLYLFSNPSSLELNSTTASLVGASVAINATNTISLVMNSILFNQRDGALSNGQQVHKVLTTDGTNKLILTDNTFQAVTNGGNTTSNELLITGNTLSNATKGFHIAFDSTANKTSLSNVDVTNNPATLISLDLHNIEFFTQGGFRVLGLNDQQSGSLALANFNGRVKIEDAFNDNEAASLGQTKSQIASHTKGGTATFTGDGTTSTFNIPHTLTTVTTHVVSRNSDVELTEFESQVSGSNIVITFGAPPNNGSVVVLNWMAFGS